jgi:tetratricopeptide (TPR) repeat protein
VSTQHFQEALEYAVQLGARQRKALCQDYLGYILRKMGEFDRAHSLHQESLALARETGDQLGIAGSTENQALVARDLGKHKEAERLLLEALAIRRGLGARWEMGCTLGHLGQVAAASGQLSKGQKWFAESMEICQAFDWVEGQVRVHSGLIEIAVARDDEESSRENLVAALPLLHKIAMLSTRLDLLGSGAAWLALCGKWERAFEVLNYVLAHKASARWTKGKMIRLQGKLEASQPAEVLANARQRGATMTWEAVTGAVAQCLGGQAGG